MGDAGVVHENVDAPARGRYPFERTRDGFGVGHVARHRLRAAAGRDDALGDRRRGAAVQIERDDMRILPAEQRGNGGADAGAGAGDDGQLVRQPEHACAAILYFSGKVGCERRQR